MAVGTNKMISTASYKAWEFGIKSAMPGFMAKQILKELVLIPERMWRYKEISRGFKDILRPYDEKLSGVGLDELYLDVTEYCAQHSISSEEQKFELAKKIWKEVFD